MLDPVIQSCCSASASAYGNNYARLKCHQGSKFVKIRTVQHNNDHALIGRMDMGGDGQVLPCIAFQGTKELADWAQNAHAQLKEMSCIEWANYKIELPASGNSRLVHAGFEFSVLALLKNGLGDYLQGLANRRVVLTGHSKGGAMAQVAALALVLSGWEVSLVSYASCAASRRACPLVISVLLHAR